MEPRMTKDFPVFDCDAHVNDPLDIWDRYVPESQKDLVRDTYWCSAGGALLNGTTVVGGGQAVGGGMYNPICIAGPQMNKKIMRKLISMTPLTAEQVTYLHHDGAVDALPRQRRRHRELLIHLVVLGFPRVARAPSCAPTRPPRGSPRS